jgi:hypothetical protein
MGKPSHTKPLPVRIPIRARLRIDRLRGLAPRETCIREVLLPRAIEAGERRVRIVGAG